jgi:hypothetical protein
MDELLIVYKFLREHALPATAKAGGAGWVALTGMWCVRGAGVLGGGD